MCIETKMADDEPRYFHGVVANFAQTDSDGANVAYRARLVPWLWFLTLRKDCRVFRRTGPRSRSSRACSTSSSSPTTRRFVNAAAHDPLPFCVQYRESTFHFISRLLEHEGIHYYFRHEADRHVMVLSDSPESPECAGQPKASYKASRATRPPRARSASGTSSGSCARALHAHRLQLRRPEPRPLAETLTKHPVREQQGARGLRLSGSVPRARRGQVARAAAHGGRGGRDAKIDGKSSCYGFTPGFQLRAGRPLSRLVQRRLPDHVGVAQFEQGVGGTRRLALREQLLVPAAKIPFRPPLATTKPTVKGVQTAVVVGESGKEIDIDDYGSVFVQFHWDRVHQRNPESSCACASAARGPARTGASSARRASARR
jgi:type VI secretion system secreted protein VgrG